MLLSFLVLASGVAAQLTVSHTGPHPPADLGATNPIDDLSLFHRHPLHVFNYLLRHGYVGRQLAVGPVHAPLDVRFFERIGVFGEVTVSRVPVVPVPRSNATVVDRLLVVVDPEWKIDALHLY